MRARGDGGGTADGDAVRCVGAGPGGVAAVAGCVTGREGAWARGGAGAGVGDDRRNLALSADTFPPMAETFPLMADLIPDHLPVIVDHAGNGSSEIGRASCRERG